MTNTNAQGSNLTFLYKQWGIAFRASGACISHSNNDYKYTRGVLICFFGIRTYVTNTPERIPNLQLWLDAQRIAQANDTEVATWTDASGNGYNAEQNTTAARPIYKTNQLNGLPVVRFDGVDDFMELVSGSLDMARNVAGLTIVAVVKYPADSSENIAFSIANDSTVSRSILLQDALNKYRAGGRRLDANPFESAISTQNATAAFIIQTGVLDYTNATLNQYINGVVDGTDDPFQTAGSTSNTASSRIRVGANSVVTAGSLLTGDIAEIIVYQRVLTANELTNVHAYLAAKWGITLA